MATEGIGVSADRFRQLYRLPVDRWQEEQLADLTAQELGGLCQLLGIPHSGSKERLRERIWRARHLRLVLAPYHTGESHAQEQAAVEALAANYRADELLALCRAAGVFAGETKYSRAVALLQWRNACRQRGAEADRADRAASADKPRQHRMRLE